MKTTRSRLLTPLLVLGLLPMLAACAEPDTAARVDVELADVSAELAKASREVRESMATESFNLSSDVEGAPDAEITADGELLIGGKPVATTAEQRAMLLEYRESVAAVAIAGADLGLQGADLATKAVGATFRGLLTGNAGDIGAQVEAEAEKIKLQALELCERLPALHDAQQRLSASLPEFAPYASMEVSGIDDCRTGLASN